MNLNVFFSCEQKNLCLGDNESLRAILEEFYWRSFSFFWAPLSQSLLGFKMMIFPKKMSLYFHFSRNTQNRLQTKTLKKSAHKSLRKKLYITAVKT